MFENKTGPTDRRTDRRTDGPTDTASFRDAVLRGMNNNTINYYEVVAYDLPHDTRSLRSESLIRDVIDELYDVDELLYEEDKINMRMTNWMLQY